jgi:DNA-binding HxlR family transcriptional regulator
VSCHEPLSLDTIKIADQGSANKYAKNFDKAERIMLQRRSHQMPQQTKATRCPAGIVTVGGRLKLQICYHLLSGTKRFGELQRLIPQASRQMLTMHLRELEQMGLLQRQVYSQMPPKVEYSLTEQGWRREPMLRQCNAWGEQMDLAF